MNRLYIPAMALALALSACDDQIMEWDPAIGTDVTKPEIPLELQEKIDNYDFIRKYAEQYHPGLALGIGMGADNYLSDSKYREVVNLNFNSVTLGNAMKMGSVISSDGSYNLTTVDNIINALPSDIALYGHNLIWHSQQAAGWLNQCIAPTIMQADPGEGATMDWVNKLPDSDLETENTDTYIVQIGEGAVSSGANGGYIDGGADGSAKCIMIHNPAEQTNNYDVQLFITYPDYPMVEGDEWRLSMDVKASTACSAGAQFHTAPGSYKHWKSFADINFTTDWTHYEAELTIDADMATCYTVALNLGSNITDYYFDNIKLERKEASAAESWVELLTNGDFESSDLSSFKAMGAATVEIVPTGAEGNGLMVNNPDVQSETYGAQLIFQFYPNTEEGDVYEFSMDVRSDAPAEFETQAQKAPGEYLHWNLFGNIPTTTEWTHVTKTITAGSDLVGMGAVAFNLGATATNYYFDNISFKKQGSEIFIEKTDEEKAAILDEQMETWIKTMVGHCKDRVHAWDVLNEPIGDNLKLRGVEYVPDELDGSEFYWGQYIGKDYAVNAFKYAREADPTATLYVNDYGLETSPEKLAKLIDYVKYIDANGGQVDGIGTQMHVHNSSITREKVDAMFQTLAATGKLVRITELDVQIKPYGSDSYSPTVDDLQQQAEIYQFIIESYFENVPEAQQGGIVIWTLTDDADEHKYWLPGDYPNLFNSDFTRKIAYKGVCDALAGYDVSTDFDGTMWNTTVGSDDDTTEE